MKLSITKKTKLTDYQNLFHFTRDIDSKEGYEVEESGYYDHYDHCKYNDRHPLNFSWRCTNHEMAKIFRKEARRALRETKNKGQVLIKLKSIRKQLKEKAHWFGEQYELISEYKEFKSI